MVRDSSSAWSSALAGGADTIVARASPRGEGALAVVRLSGPATAAIAGAVCPQVDFGDPWRASLVDFRDVHGECLERGVAIPYRGPRSFTGEDMLEAVLHGSPYLVEALVASFVAAGARPASPGEFSRRALVNGKLDLLQAEAIRDLIGADTAWQVRNARQQLEGELSRWVETLRGELTALLAEVEASLDFAEHGAEVVPQEWRRRRDGVRERIAAMVATAAAGRRIRDGVRVVILGPPNAGKSTLFNRLLGSERAIVSPHPGTTRDTIEAELELAGLLVVLVDTAGLREGGDAVEEEGVRRSRSAAASAQVVLELWPADAGGPPPVGLAGGGRAVVRVLSKCDLLGGPAARGWVPVSSVGGDGLDALRARLEEEVVGGVSTLDGGIAIAERHRLALERADAELERSDPEQPELAAAGVRWALQALDELVGVVSGEDVLDRIFATFCIGK